MRAASDKYQPNEFVVLAVSVREEAAVVSSFIDRYGLSNPFLMDSEGLISRQYNVYSTPTTYFIGPDGVITDVLPGVLNEPWLERNIAAVASG